MERRLGAKGRLVVSQAVRPRCRQLGLETGQPQVADDQTQVAGNRFDVRLPDVAEPSQDGRHGPENAVGVGAVRPQLLEPVFVEEHRGQVRLRIEVHGHHRVTELGVHPGEVIDQRGLADPPLVVEEGDRLHRALQMVASTWEGSNVNFASGLPFFRRASCARITPRPNALT